jgi:hypothetical protein
MSKLNTLNYNYDTTPLLHEIEHVVNKGLSNILNDFNDRYTLLETTQHKIMELLQNTIGTNKCNNIGTSDINNISEIHSASDKNDNSTDEEEDETMFVSIQDMTKELVKNEVEQYRISNAEQMNDMRTLIHLLLTKITNLENEVKKINQDEDNSVKENIKLVIEEKINLDNNLTTDKNCITNGDNLLNKEKQLESIDSDSCGNESSDNESNDNESIDNESNNSITITEPSKKEKESINKEKEEIEENEEKEEKEEKEEIEENEEEEEEDEEQKEKEEENDDVEEKEQLSEEEELFSIEINNVTYCTNDETNGYIYELLENDDIGNKLGRFKNGKSYFF